ncbi:hypothetical protein OAH77_04515 [Flavobacteriaceae bacterium]|nr:hypothetical protein [Flavobacteriaceae bacterium]
MENNEVTFELAVKFSEPVKKEYIAEIMENINRALASEVNCGEGLSPDSSKMSLVSKGCVLTHKESGRIKGTDFY